MRNGMAEHNAESMIQTLKDIFNVGLLVAKTRDAKTRLL